MAKRAEVTKLVLGALGQTAQISTLQDRKRIQKSIYLAQSVGVDLGYYFNWYLMGPYCSSLAKDYYELNQSTAGDENVGRLRDDVLEKLRKVSEAATSRNKPVGLNDVDWLEALASIHYLDNVARLDKESVARKIEREKPHLKNYVEQAREVVSGLTAIKVQ